MAQVNLPVDGDDAVYNFNTSDITASSIVSEVLTGRENFVAWERSMEIALSIRSKFDFVLGLHPRPTDPVSLAKWRRCDRIIISWLLNSVSKRVRSHILHAKDAASAWRILHNRYAGSNVSRKFFLKKEISNIRQADMDIATYFEKLNGYWKELDAMSKLCFDEETTCNQCQLSLAEREDDRVIEFLMGLNECYSHIRTHLLAQPELPDLDTAYDMVINDESQQNVTKNICVEMSAMYKGSYEQQSSKANKNSQTKGKEKLYCSHCKMSGHTKDFCYKLHGYPPGHKLYKGNVKTNYRGGNNTKGVNFVAATTAADTASDNSISQLTNSQVTQLLALLKKNEPNNKCEEVHHMTGICLTSSKVHYDHLTWIIDSGASNHFTCRYDILSDVHKLSTSYNVSLPNGLTTTVSHAGTVRLHNSFILHNVLYAPDFKFNLISVSKLILDSDTIVSFDKDGCMIQDHAHKTNLRIGRLVTDLYFLDADKNCDRNTCPAAACPTIASAISAEIWIKEWATYL